MRDIAIVARVAKFYRPIELPTEKEAANPTYLELVSAMKET